MLLVYLFVFYPFETSFECFLHQILHESAIFTPELNLLFSEMTVLENGISQHRFRSILSLSALILRLYCSSKFLSNILTRSTGPTDDGLRRRPCQVPKRSRQSAIQYSRVFWGRLL